MNRHLHSNSIFIGVICVFVSGGQQYASKHFELDGFLRRDRERKKEAEREIKMRGKKSKSKWSKRLVCYVNINFDAFSRFV